MSCVTLDFYYFAITLLINQFIKSLPQFKIFYNFVIRFLSPIVSFPTLYPLINTIYNICRITIKFDRDMSGLYSFKRCNSSFKLLYVVCSISFSAIQFFYVCLIFCYILQYHTITTNVFTLCIATTSTICIYDYFTHSHTSLSFISYSACSNLNILPLNSSTGIAYTSITFFSSVVYLPVDSNSISL